MLTKDKYRGICRIHTCSSCSIKMINQSAVKKKKTVCSLYCERILCVHVLQHNYLHKYSSNNHIGFYFIVLFHK